MAMYQVLERDEINFVNYVNKSINKNNLILFDVGSNRGLYVDLFLKFDHNVQIHMFEPIKSLYDGLYEKFKSNNIFINNIAISNKIGESIFCELTSPVTDGCSSLIERPVFNERCWSYVKKMVKTNTIDNYCRTYNIEYIDFLKIDVEGAELSVLEGSINMLKGKKIKYIQFEYGNTFSDANIKLLDVYNLVINFGYKLFNYENNIFDEITENNIERYSKNEICNFIIILN